MYLATEEAILRYLELQSEHTKLQTKHLTGILGTLKDISELLREIRDSNADISNHTSEPMSVYVQNHADI